MSPATILSLIRDRSYAGNIRGGGGCRAIKRKKKKKKITGRYPGGVPVNSLLSRSLFLHSELFHLFLCCQLQKPRPSILIHRAELSLRGRGFLGDPSLIDSLLTDSITPGYRLCDYDPVQSNYRFVLRAASCDGD